MVRWDVAFADLFVVAMTLIRPGAVATAVAVGVSSRPEAADHRPPAPGYERSHQLRPATGDLSVITDDDFEDPALIARRRRDHERIDRILAIRVAAEDHAIGGVREARWIGFLHQPTSSRRFSAKLDTRSG